MIRGRFIVVGCAALAVVAIGCGFSVAEDDMGQPNYLRSTRTKSAPDAGAPAEPSPASTSADPVAPADAGSATPAPVDAGPPPVLRAFVTSTRTKGAFGGPAAADKACNDAAKAATLPGTYRAWISTPAESAIARLTSAGPWVRVDGKVLADKAGLTEGDLARNLDRDERGQTPPVEDNRAWTGTSKDGTYAGPDCNGWTSESNASTGRTGEAEFEDLRWTSSVNDPCDQPKRFYCFGI